ncbi:MAG: polysulfide reductase NrfD [Bacteroidetes bacterium]|nr:polysulfide reductase NrfD [Bacteroidota bacterium]MCW5894942.1 polysulfide reductase NrfD [Bacteroidota bacterium]
MHELTTTRTNPQIDPSLHIWGWEIPVYLFLGGLVAGIMIISGYFIFKGRYKHSYFSCFWLPHISLVLLSAGMFALFLDLEHKLYVWRLFTTFKIASPMSWGSWILILVYPTLLASTLTRVPPAFQNRIKLFDKISAFINERPALVKNIGVLSMIVGAILGMYTGVLLSALGARPLWNSSILWVLFLTSGLSAAAAFVHLITDDKYERELLAKADNGFLILELFIFAQFIIGLLSSTQAHQNAAQLILSGSYAAVFWVFVIGIGIIIPLIIQLLAVNHKVQHTPVAPIMVIAGGLILRFVIVYAGQYSHWTIAGL